MIFQECVTAGGWQRVEIPSSSGEWDYHVLVPPWDRVESEVICECKGYEHRGYCSHQAQALASICAWRSEMGDLPIIPYKKCPECGEKVRTVIE